MTQYVSISRWSQNVGIWSTELGVTYPHRYIDWETDKSKLLEWLITIYGGTFEYYSMMYEYKKLTVLQADGEIVVLKWAL